MMVIFNFGIAINSFKAKNKHESYKKSLNH